MGPKSKKHKFRAFNSNTVQEIEGKLKETGLTTSSKRSQNNQGNYRKQNILHTKENSNDGKFENRSILEQDYKDISGQNIEETSSPHVSESFNDTKCQNESATSGNVASEIFNITSEVETSISIHEASSSAEFYGSSTGQRAEQQSVYSEPCQWGKNESSIPPVTQYDQNSRYNKKSGSDISNKRSAENQSYGNRGDNKGNFNRQYEQKWEKSSWQNKESSNQSEIESKPNENFHYDNSQTYSHSNKKQGYYTNYRRSGNQFHGNRSDNYRSNRRQTDNISENSKYEHKKYDRRVDRNQPKSMVVEASDPSLSTSTEEKFNDGNNDGDDSRNDTYHGDVTNEQKDDFWNWDKERESAEHVSQFQSNQKITDKPKYTNRKSESFVNVRNEQKDYSRRSDSHFLRPFLSEDFNDPEYKEFQKEVNESENVVFDNVKEIEGDLFEMSEEYALGHCVAADMRMGSGIAVKFKKTFGNLAKLLSQNQKPGGLALLESNTKDGKRYIYYLVSKQLSNGKPTYGNFWFSLKKMRNHIRDNAVKKLAIPKIGCGLDRLEWTVVKRMIEFLFRDVDVEIIVCNFQQSEDAPLQKDNTCKVVFDENPVVKIDNGTIIIYFSTEKGDIEEDVVELSEKFKFLDKFKKAPKSLGSAIRFEDRSKNYLLYGCIVRKSLNGHFDFESFAKCLSQIKKDNRKDGFCYVAYQSIIDRNDYYINDKIITLLRNLLRDVDVYVCKSNKTDNLNLEE